MFILIADLGYARSTRLKTPPADYERALLERVAAVPGVTSVADSTVLPLSGSSWGNAVWRDGAAPDGAVDGNGNRVSPGYFRTLGIRLTAGRDFSDGDNLHSPNVAIVNLEFARRVMNTLTPVGQRFRIEATPDSPESIYEIVGVAGNTKYFSLREKVRPIFYLPIAQFPPQRGGQLVFAPRCRPHC